MKFQLAGAWPVSGGRLLVPAGTVLDRSSSWRFMGIELPWPMPVNAVALDQEAYDEMLKHHARHLILTAGEINRHADPEPK